MIGEGLPTFACCQARTTPATVLRSARPIAGKAEQLCGDRQFLRLGRAAQEGEIRLDGEFGIGGLQPARSCEKPMHEPARRACGGAVKALTEKPVAAARHYPRPGNSRVSALLPPRATIPARCVPGPSERATRCRARRQRKWSGGPSGTSVAGTSTGSGWRKRRIGRSGRDFPDHGRFFRSA